MPVTRYEQIAEYKRRLLDNEADAMARMTQYAGHTWLQVQTGLQHLLNALDDARATGREVSPSWLYEGNRLANLADQIRQNVDAFGQYASGDVYRQVQDAIAQAGSDAADAVRGALGPPPPGISPDAALVGSFGTVAADTLDAIAARVAPGSPVDDLFQGFGDDAADAASKALVTGVTLGWGPAQIAAQVQGALGVPLSRAMTISRTETLGAYRDATQANYQANSDVVDQWVWVAELGPNTCEVCWAMNGQAFPLDEPMDSHVNCRCAMAPVTKSWDELLGLDEGASGIEENRPVVPNGEEAFARAPESVQRQVLGPSKFALYATGQLSLGDLVRRTTDPTWGRTLQSKPLRALGFTQRHISQALERIRRMDLHSAAYRAELLARARGETAVGVEGGVARAATRRTSQASIAEVEAAARGRSMASTAPARPPTAEERAREVLANKRATVADLKAAAKELDLAPGKTKAETIQRIMDYLGGKSAATAAVPVITGPRDRVRELLSNPRATLAQLRTAAKQIGLEGAPLRTKADALVRLREHLAGPHDETAAETATGTAATHPASTAWPTHMRDDVPLPNNPDWERRVGKYQAKIIRDLAAEHGMTVPEYTRAVDAHLKQLVQGATVYINRSLRGLDRIAASGEIKTLHETGTSSVNYTAAQRAKAEETILGVPRDAPAAEHPIYAYLEQPGGASATFFYGGAKIELSPDVLARATVTFADTLMDNAVGRRPALSPRPALEVDHLAWPFLQEGGRVNDPLKITSLNDIKTYVEVQIYGGVKLADMMQATIDERAVPWTRGRQAEVDRFNAQVAEAQPQRMPESPAREPAPARGRAGMSDLTTTSRVPAEVLRQIADAIPSGGVTRHDDAQALGQTVRQYIESQLPPGLAVAAETAAAIRAKAPDDLTEQERQWVGYGKTEPYGGVRFAEAQDKYAAAVRETTLRLLNQVRDTGGVDLAVDETGNPKHDATVAGHLADASALLPREWLEASNARGALTALRDHSRTGGGYYLEDAAGNGTIAVKYNKQSTPEELRTTAIHELGHRMEHAIPGIAHMEQDFYERRTAGDAWTPLTNGIQEDTKLDQWADEYLGRRPYFIQGSYDASGGPTGRKFGQYSYELLSVGLEWLLGETGGAWQFQRDPEYLDFILGILFGA